MVGRGVLRECLKDNEVEEVVTVGRTATGEQNPKLREITHADFSNFDAIDEEMKNVDACIYSVGVTSTSVDAETYDRITRDFTINAANALIKHNPNMTFVFISAMGADTSSNRWAGIKKQTEQTIINMPWHGYVLRPGMIRPMNGEESRTTLYRYGYRILKPVVAFVHWVAPSWLTTTENIGQAFLHLSKYGSATDQQVFENNEINLIIKPQEL